jgi:hypothetical protein
MRERGTAVPELRVLEWGAFYFLTDRLGEGQSVEGELVFLDRIRKEG